MKYLGANLNKVMEEVVAYVSIIDNLFGLYLDCTQGFLANYNNMIKGQAEIAKTIPPGTDIDALDMFICRGGPNDPNNVMLHRTTQGEFKLRNALGASNYVRIAQLLIVLLFEFWETEHRARVAVALGLSKATDLKLPLLGDIRLLRNDIIHNQAVISEETVKKLEVIVGLSPNAVLRLTPDDVEGLIRRIKGTLDDLVVESGGTDPKHRTLWHIR